MPSINQKYLSTTSLRTPSPGRLQPTLLSPRANKINILGAAVRSPGSIRPEVATPQINQDLIGPAIESAGQQLGRAAIAWENDKAELEANDASLKYQSEMREIWLGKETKEGFQPGYASTRGEKAVNGHDSFQTLSNSLRNQYIESLGENAASRFISKTFSIHNGYLNSGASHAATGKKVWESDQLKAQGQQLSIELSDAGLNPKAVGAKLTAYGRQITSKLGEAAAEPVIQNYFRQHAGFLSTQPGGLEKLAAFKNVIGGVASEETKITLNTQIRTITRRNVTDARQSAAEESRKTREARETRGIELRTQLWNGQQISENALHTMLQKRQIDSSTHDYLVLNQREGISIPAISGADIYQHKADILYGKTDSADIDSLGLNSQDNKTLHNYMTAVSSQQSNSDLRLIRQEITRIGSNPLFPNSANNIFSATKAAENIYLKAKSDGKPISPYTALQQASTNYFDTKLSQQTSPPPIQIGPFLTPPRNEAHLMELYNQWKKGSSNLTPEDRQVQFDLFKAWRAKYSADADLQEQRVRRLKETEK